MKRSFYIVCFLVIIIGGYLTLYVSRQPAAVKNSESISMKRGKDITKRMTGEEFNEVPHDMQEEILQDLI